MANLQKVTILNVNDLAQAIRPEEGREFLGGEIRINITPFLQTSAGRMIFDQLVVRASALISTII